MREDFSNQQIITKANTNLLPSQVDDSKFNNSDIYVQISTAKKYPRSITYFKEMAMTIATNDEETASSCFYKLSRGGKEIEGASVRLAEIVGSSWGNLRYGAKVVHEDDRWIIAQGVAHDLETNVAMTIEVRRRISDKHGKRYSDDMIAVTANAACSIALRNAIFKVVPKVFVDSIYEAAKRVAIGDATTLIARRQRALDHFQKMGVSIDKILLVLKKNGIDDIDLKDLETLTGIKTAIKDGEISVDDAFSVENKDNSKSLLDKLKTKASDEKSKNEEKKQPEKQQNNHFEQIVLEAKNLFAKRKEAATIDIDYKGYCSLYVNSPEIIEAITIERDLAKEKLGVKNDSDT